MRVWLVGCPVFQVLCKPVIMLFCILSFSLDVIVEWRLKALSIIKHDSKVAA